MEVILAIDNMQKKDNLLIKLLIIILISMISLSFLLLYIFQLGDEENIDVLLGIASEETSEILMNSNRYYIACTAIESGNNDLCDDLKEEVDKYHCNYYVRMFNYDKIALEGDCNDIAKIGDQTLTERRIALCEKIKSDSCSGLEYDVYEKYCQNLLNMDIENCVDADSTKDDCELDILTFHALKNKDPSECDGISYFYARNFCKGVVAGCSSAFIDDWAHFSVSRTLDDLTLCDNIVNPEIKTLCQYEWLPFSEAIKERFL